MNLIPNTESLRNHINQNGVRPGPRKLEQFQTALRLRRTPEINSQDGVKDKKIYVKFFNPTGAQTWFVTEWDGEDEVFCYMTGTPDPEWGYMDLVELSSIAGRLGIGMEIDTDFLPKLMSEIKALDK